MVETEMAPGQRPWAYWRFVLDEERPRDRTEETLRLAGLGELRDDELAAIAAKAVGAKVRIGTDSERVSGGALAGPQSVPVDREAVELYEAVSETSSRSRGRD